MAFTVEDREILLPGEVPNSLRHHPSLCLQHSSPVKLVADEPFSIPTEIQDEIDEKSADMEQNLEKISEKIDCIIARLMQGCKTKLNAEGINVNVNSYAMDDSLCDASISSRVLEDHVERVIQRLSERKVHHRSKFTSVSEANKNIIVITPRKCVASIMKDGEEKAEISTLTPRSLSSSSADLMPEKTASRGRYRSYSSPLRVPTLLTPRSLLSKFGSSGNGFTESVSPSSADLIPQKAASDGRYRSTTPIRVPTMLTPRSLLSKFSSSDEVRSPPSFSKSSSPERKEKPSRRRLAVALSFLASSPRKGACGQTQSPKLYDGNGSYIES